MKRFFAALTTLLVTGLTPLLSWAVETAHPLGFQEANGIIAEKVVGTYNLIFWICLVIYILVQGIILWCIFAYRRSKKRSEKDAKQFSHSTTMEIIWTAIPVLICAVIGWQAWQGLKFIRTVPEKAIAIDVIAYQFGWSFDYPELDISAPAPIEADTELTVQETTPRYVKEMVVPVNTNIVLNVTSQDVIHGYFVPVLGTKIDAIPGRINYQWFNANRTGNFVGQCTELCGSAHGEMFFRLRVVEQDQWQEWVNTQRQEKGLEPLSGAQFASLSETGSLE